jgi:hypothetical protein
MKINFKRRSNKDFSGRAPITLKCLYLNTITRQRWALPIVGEMEELIVIAAINSATNQDMFSNASTAKKFREQNGIPDDGTFVTIYDIQNDKHWKEIQTGVMYQTFFGMVPTDVFIPNEYYKTVFEQAQHVIGQARLINKHKQQNSGKVQEGRYNHNPTIKQFDSLLKAYQIQLQEDLEEEKERQELIECE